jgi:hypothetical protein
VATRPRPRFERRHIRAALLAIVTTAVLGAACVRNKAPLVFIRDIVYTDYTPDLAYLNAAPNNLPSEGYRFDSPQAIADWRPRLDRIFGAAVVSQVEQAPNDLARARAIVGLLGKRSAASRTGCGFTDDLEQKLELVPRGYGCCSDSGEAFVAIASALGFPAREANNSVHSFNEFFDRDLSKWVFIDAYYGVLAHDARGDLLSASEFRDAVLRRESTSLEFFLPPPVANANEQALNSSSYYSIRGFTTIAYPWSNNVYEASQFDLKYGFLPRPIRRTFAHAFSIRPDAELLLDGTSVPRVRRNKAMRWGLLGLAIVVAVSLTRWLGAICVRLVSGRSLEARTVAASTDCEDAGVFGDE